MKIENASSMPLVVQRKCHFFLAGHWLIKKLQVLTLKKVCNCIKDFNSTNKKFYSKWAHKSYM